MPEHKKGVVPRLRFPEFRDAEEWKLKRLGKCLEYQQPTLYLVSDANYSDSYNIPVLTAGKTFLLGYTNEKNGVFREPLPVIIFDDFTTATKFVDFPFKVKSSALKILQAKEGINIRFMYELMQMISYEVGAHERHWISKFQPMFLPIPQSKEQQKIADCLSSLDEVIELEAQKLEAFKTHKKGLMQQLFPREGETTPRLRFPEFRNAGEWEVVTLKTLAVRRNERNSDGNLIQVLTNSAEEGVVNQRDYFDKDIAVQGNLKDYFIVDKGDFIYNPRVSALAPVGPISRNNIGKGIMSPLYTVFCFNRPNSDFYMYYFKSTAWHSYLRKVGNIGARHDRIAISNDDFMAMPVPDPLSAEQQKIADCLSSLDEMIEFQAKKLEALKTHKKGLMQQLFPQEVD